MAGVPADKIFLLGLFGDAASLALLMAGTATPHWLNYPFTSQQVSLDVHRGLFQACVNGVCRDIEPSDYERAVQIMTILGIVLCGISVILAVAFLISAMKRKPQSKTLPYLSGILSSIAGLLAFCGALIYEVDVYSISTLGTMGYLYSSLGYSFALNMTGSIILLMTGSFVMGGGNRMIGGQRRPDDGVVISTVPVVYQAQVAVDPFQNRSAVYGGQVPHGQQFAVPSSYSPQGFNFQPAMAPPPYSEAVSLK